jgi:predicted Zn-ribbon and HTH transcriptional regulator
MKKCDNCGTIYKDDEIKEGYRCGNCDFGIVKTVKVCPKCHGQDVTDKQRCIENNLISSRE